MSVEVWVSRTVTLLPSFEKFSYEQLRLDLTDTQRSRLGKQRRKSFSESTLRRTDNLWRGLLVHSFVRSIEQSIEVEVVQRETLTFRQWHNRHITYVNYTQKCDPNAQLSSKIGKEKTLIQFTAQKSAVRVNSLESWLGLSTRINSSAMWQLTRYVGELRDLKNQILESRPKLERRWRRRSTLIENSAPKIALAICGMTFN